MTEDQEARGLLLVTELSQLRSRMSTYESILTQRNDLADLAWAQIRVLDAEIREREAEFNTLYGVEPQST